MNFWEGDYTRIVSIPRGFFEIYDYSVRDEILGKFRERERERALEAISEGMGEASKHLQDVVRGLVETAQIFTSYILSEALDFEGLER